MIPSSSITKEVRAAASTQGLKLQKLRSATISPLYRLVNPHTNTVVYPSNHPFGGVTLGEIREYLA